MQYKAIVIGGSAGSFPVVTRILNSLSATFPIPVIMCLHRLKHVREGFVEALSLKSQLPVVEPYDKERVKSGMVYLAPANYHLSLELGFQFSLSTEPLVNHSRPAIDITFETAGMVYNKGLIGILLSGANRDGAAGMKKINEYGGLTMVQDPNECKINTMPNAALQATTVDYVLDSDRIIEFLLKV